MICELSLDKPHTPSTLKQFSAGCIILLFGIYSNILILPRVIAIGNNKGGIGKTTTAANLATGLVRRGRRVLAIDNDPQGHIRLL